MVTVIGLNSAFSLDDVDVALVAIEGLVAIRRGRNSSKQQPRLAETVAKFSCPRPKSRPCRTTHLPAFVWIELLTNAY